ncbi:MAG: hypothetical protein P8L20_05285 [Flavobacteriales bacterium]|nr:hypothetical protein [Flavobacteriales bacterium]
MKKPTTIFFVLTILFAAFGAISCKKRKLNNSTVTSQDNAIAEMVFNDAFKVTEDAMKQNGLEKTGLNLSSIYNACATVHLTPPLGDTTFPKTLIIDFGAVNCEGAYGIERRGKVMATVSGYYRDSGTIISIQTDDYYVNDYKVEGVKTVTNNGLNPDNQTYFTIVISGAVITYPNGDVASYESNRIRTWVIGEATQGLMGIFDDEYDIIGTASGINREGRPYAMTITSALRVAISCRWVKQGVIQIAPEDLYERTVGFGDGTCDREVSAEIKGSVYNFLVH